MDNSARPSALLNLSPEPFPGRPAGSVIPGGPTTRRTPGLYKPSLINCQDKPVVVPSHRVAPVPAPVDLMGDKSAPQTV